MSTRPRTASDIEETRQRASDAAYSAAHAGSAARRSEYRRGQREPRLMGLVRLLEDTTDDWQDQAACKGQTELFYSPHVVDEVAAKAICAECPVREPCSEQARTNREFGTWGGEGEVDRARAGRKNPMMTGRAGRVRSPS